MPTTSESSDDYFDATIQQGRAAVRLIESIDVLLLDVAEPAASELRVLQQRYRQRLRTWVAELPPAEYRAQHFECAGCDCIDPQKSIDAGCGLLA